MAFSWITALLPLAISLPCVLGLEVTCPLLCNCTAPPNISVICTTPGMNTFPSAFPRNTVSISVEFTNITTIAPKSLSELPLLEELHLSNNGLTSLPDRLLEPLIRLHTLDLTDNFLTSVPHTLLLNMPNLKSLILSGNLLTNLWTEDDFVKQKLQWLDLSRNRISVLYLQNFSSFHYMKNLDLSYNKLHELPATLFRKMNPLRRINLEGNQLSTLPPNLFIKNSLLEHVFLARNNLSFVPDKLLNTHFIQTVDLSENNLHTQSSGLYQVLQQVQHRTEQTLDLSNNPWHCDCQLLYLYGWMAKHKNILYSLESTRCEKPNAFKNAKLVQLYVPEEDMIKSCPVPKILTEDYVQQRTFV
ncbi:leucine-rich alpha-2-glycoprotein [Bombina bombina]|uniref:leucine-rich alpha-2-glycoprotein n=1 Tax=Bombina bombina TaxID=8345 RepID=UPI00235AD860|nr:leucine-rich alpha-2-glycoprotein [Bombina bombina]